MLHPCAPYCTERGQVRVTCYDLLRRGGQREIMSQLAASSSVSLEPHGNVSATQVSSLRSFFFYPLPTSFPYMCFEPYPPIAASFPRETPYPSFLQLRLVREQADRLVT